MSLSSKNVNYVGIWSLYKREVIRFMKVYNQTLLAPAINAMIFLAVFSLAIGNHAQHVNDIPFNLFMASGLIIMSVVQNAFANTSSVLIMGKVTGTIVDYIMPPFKPLELCFSLILGAVTRGFLVGIIVTILISFFVKLTIFSFNYIMFYLFVSSVILALLGIFAGFFSETFDQMAAVTSYIINPLSFLSGTFYSIKDLPNFLYVISQYNPFFYMIDGFRYGMTGKHDGDLLFGIYFMMFTIILLFSVVYIMLAKGYRIKN